MSAGAGWAATALATLLASVLRLVGLDRVGALVFDETYYVKDAYSLWHLGYEGTWADDWDARFASGDFSGLSSKGAYIVHPQTGKWLIGLGMRVFGWDDPVGWRISAALAGIIGVLLLCRIAWNLFRSPAITLMAGMFLATDGMHLVMSRTGLLDVFLATFVEAGVLAVVKDQQQAHPALVGKMARWQPGAPSGERTGLGPHSGPRWWLLAAGVLLGLACSVKWSGIYALAVLGLFVALREWTTRRRLGHPRPFRAAMLLDVPVAFLAMVPTAVVVYIASWWGWMVHPDAWAHGRSGASGGSASGPLAVASDLWSYHLEMWRFHNGLHTPHNYQSQPWGWLLQLRPTSFWYERVDGACGGTAECVQNVVALGNPLMWWLAVPALLLTVWGALRFRDWRCGLVLCGYLAMYVPWFAYSHRTIFTFYTVAVAPFVALSLAWALGVCLDQARLGVSPDRISRADGSDFDEGDHRWLGPGITLRRALGVAALVAVIAVLASSAYFYPVWTGPRIPYDEWLSRMWLQSWI
jgi:dolichyl-phosphate-mannose--protein O-mannosyl transferase